jgi:hypothetical protein
VSRYHVLVDRAPARHFIVHDQESDRRFTDYLQSAARRAAFAGNVA